MRRTKTARTVTKERRVYRVVRVTKQILQCERPYVLFGEAVRTGRLALGITQQELADRLGYARASIANIETGRQRVLLTDVFDFAKALKIKPQKIFEAVQQ
jgi:DNA-binding XRE family transcriptional regulator